jgi:Protein of unknown function (DUF4238)
LENIVKTKQRNVRQHIVPKFYLRLFADENKKVWSYDKTNGNVFDRVPKVTATEDNIYSPKDTNGIFNDGLDQLFDKIESDSAEKFKNLSCSGVLVPSDKEQLSVFIAMLKVRSPGFMNAYALAYGDAVQLLAREHVRNRECFNTNYDQLDQKLGRSTNAESREIVRKRLLDGSGNVLKIRKQVGLLSVEMLMPISQILKQMTWTVLTSPDQQLVTSDSPVFEFGLKYGRLLKSSGLEHRDTKIVVPLSPSGAILCQWGDGQAQKAQRISKRHAELLNEVQISGAERHIFSSRKNPAIGNLVKKYPAPGFRYVISGTSSNAKVLLKR